MYICIWVWGGRWGGEVINKHNLYLLNTGKKNTRAIFWSSCIGYLIQMEQDITPVMSSYIHINQSLFIGHRSRNLLWYISWSLFKPSVEIPWLLILGLWLFHHPSVSRIYIVLPKLKTQFLGKRSYTCTAKIEDSVSWQEKLQMCGWVLIFTSQLCIVSVVAEETCLCKKYFFKSFLLIEQMFFYFSNILTRPVV